MRHRTVGLVASVLLVAPLTMSCTRPRPGPPTTATGNQPAGLPAGRGQDCGTITVGQPNQQAVSCFGQYHFFQTLYLTVVDSDVTTRYQAEDHKMTVTKIGPDGTTSVVCEGFSDSQFTMSANGRAGTTCRLP